MKHWIYQMFPSQTAKICDDRLCRHISLLNKNLQVLPPHLPHGRLQRHMIRSADKSLGHPSIKTCHSAMVWVWNQMFFFFKSNWKTDRSLETGTRRGKTTSDKVVEGVVSYWPVWRSFANDIEKSTRINIRTTVALMWIQRSKRKVEKSEEKFCAPLRIGSRNILIKIHRSGLGPRTWMCTYTKYFPQVAI